METFIDRLRVELEIDEGRVESIYLDHLNLPTFGIGHLIKDDDPEYTDRIELFIAGREIANFFCELNDPLDQEERFDNQLLQKDLGDQEAMAFDDDYIAALKYGMPPAVGVGMGIDRLVMLATDKSSIRDVVFFPTLK